MSGTGKSRRWLLALAAAVLFPALAFHASCIAVMGPGTWGSGMQEAYPEFQPATKDALEYHAEFAALPQGDFPALPRLPPPSSDSIVGDVRQSDRAASRTVWLTSEGSALSDRQHLYSLVDDDLTEIPMPAGHFVTRPRLFGERLLYERWNPWAVSAVRKLRRYVASWVDPTLRPEAALYEYNPSADEWEFLMPGHTLIPSPDHSRAVLLRSGAMAAGYYSIHLWEPGRGAPPAILSLREADSGSGRSFSMQWSADSRALHLVGRTGGFERKRREPRDFNLIFLVDSRQFHDLDLQP